MSECLAVSRLAEDKAKEVQWRAMLEDRTMEQAERVEQKEAEDSQEVYMGNSTKKDEDRVREVLTLKTRDHFTALPAELRNRIYSFCQEPDRPLRLKSRTQGSDKRPIGKYLALTQVSRQIRAEFKPMYRNKIGHAILRPWEAVRFVETFFPCHEMDEEMENKNSKSARSVGNAAEFSATHWTSRSINICVILGPFAEESNDNTRNVVDLKPLL